MEAGHHRGTSQARTWSPTGSWPRRRRDKNRDANRAAAWIPVGQAGTPAGTTKQCRNNKTHVRRKSRPQHTARNFACTSPKIRTRNTTSGWGRSTKDTLPQLLRSDTLLCNQGSKGMQTLGTQAEACTNRANSGRNRTRLADDKPRSPESASTPVEIGCIRGRMNPNVGQCRPEAATLAHNRLTSSKIRRHRATDVVPKSTKFEQDDQIEFGRHHRAFAESGPNLAEVWKIRRITSRPAAADAHTGRRRSVVGRRSMVGRRVLLFASQQKDA